MITSSSLGRPYAEVIGDPVAHSRSPAIHNFWLARLGIEADYRKARVRAEELGDYFASRRADPLWRGCNVTIPHKEKVADFLDQVDAKAAGIGAVNTVYRFGDSALQGTNTDVDGIAEAVVGTRLAGCHAVVLGAGGAARAGFAFLAGQNCASVRVLARSPEKAARAARDCGLPVDARSFQAGSGALDGASLLINATQLGMAGQDPMPDFVLKELSAMAEEALVFDMVYAPLRTELLMAAGRRGLRVSDGLAMLIGQAATAFARFFGQEPVRTGDADLRTILTS